MKVGIDGVLLGIWANVQHANRILDIGTGTGLIALMLAQRSVSKIVGIDIDYNAILQANENIKNSPWRDRIDIQEYSLQNYVDSKSQQFDLIVSNPPYFVNSTKTPLDSRTYARHTDSLSHEELIVNAIKLLNPTGRISIILPIKEGLQCIEFSKGKGLYCTKQVSVFPKSYGMAKRFLLEFRLLATLKEVSELIIETEERHQYSPEFTLLAKDFYLKL